MKFKDLASVLATEMEIEQSEANNLVHTVFDSIADALVAGEKVHIVGFGTFVVKQKVARFAVNPKTGERMTISACETPSFKPVKSMKEMLS